MMVAKLYSTSMEEEISAFFRLFDANEDGKGLHFFILVLPCPVLFLILVLLLAPLGLLAPPFGKVFRDVLRIALTDVRTGAIEKGCTEEAQELLGRYGGVLGTWIDMCKSLSHADLSEADIEQFMNHAADEKGMIDFQAFERAMFVHLEAKSPGSSPSRARRVM